MTAPILAIHTQSKMDYNEDNILTDYIWQHYTHLMTDFERQIGHAILGRIKADVDTNPRTAALLRKSWGRADDPAINAVLRDGTDVFRRKVCDRLLNTCADQLFINRCPACQRIVRTPKACLCTWCGHIWYM